MKIEWGIPITNTLPLKIVPLSNVKWVEVSEQGSDIIVTIRLQKGFWQGWFNYVNKITIDDQQFVEFLLSYIQISPSLFNIRNRPL